MAEMRVCARNNPTGFDQGLFQQCRRRSKFLAGLLRCHEDDEPQGSCRYDVMRSAFVRVVKQL
jgi:hypothetical protein